MKWIGWFTTARGPGSFNLFKTMLDNIKDGSVDAKISFVFINREVKGNQFRLKLIGMAEEAGIPVILFPSDTFEPELKREDLPAWRDAYGKAIREQISKYPMDFGALAGYMLILDPETCRRYTIINLHPALPDTYKGTWEEIVAQVVENGDERYGATIHLCTPELDRGETLCYDSFLLESIRTKYPVKDDQMKQVRAEELRREAYLLIGAIKMIVDGEIVIKDGKALDRHGKGIGKNPCLSEKIDKKLRES
ncbi:MAG: formyltransferase family protein [Methanomassiliicoccales archaeon]|jgi:phosphoribosylglycinamide formyltransferase-1